MASDDLGDVLARVSADLRSAGLSVTLGVFDLALGTWAAGRGDVTPSGFGTDGYVLVIGRNQHALRVDDSGQVDAAEILSEAQDWAIDELGRGWPEARASGGGSSILRPANNGGELVWTDGSEWVVPAGRLDSAGIS